MINHNYGRYFRVFQNDTTVTEISTNDFKPVEKRIAKKKQSLKDKPDSIDIGEYVLPPDETFFYGYSNRAKAMEMAKAGALRYINLLIAQGKESEETLLQYRSDHFEDLNNTLTYVSIEALKAKSEPLPTCSEYVSAESWF